MHMAERKRVDTPPAWRCLSGAASSPANTTLVYEQCIPVCHWKFLQAVGVDYAANTVQETECLHAIAGSGRPGRGHLDHQRGRRTGGPPAERCRQHAPRLFSTPCTPCMKPSCLAGVAAGASMRPTSVTAAFSTWN